MNEQLKPEIVSSPEKLSDKILKEYHQIHDEMMEIMFQMGELERKFLEGGLKKEEFDSNVSERAELFAQFDSKRKIRDRLEEQWRAVKDREIAQKNNYINELDQEK